MEKNVGGIDKAARIMIGLALLSLIFFFKGTERWVALLGIIPLTTGLFGFCPLYTILKINTCPQRRAG